MTRCTLVGGLALALALTVDLPAEAQGRRTRPFQLSGYMDFQYNKREFEDGEIDFQRFVLLFTHSFTDRIKFVGELELEHAVVEGLEDKGELELEQAYVDFQLTRAFNVRAGQMLVPVGIINERHETPTYYGVDRPFVDTVIIPTTWFEAGAGIHGEIGSGFRYRGFIFAPLNAAEFTAEEGIREGQQHGSEANAGRVAYAGRVEYTGIRGLTVGAAVWSGQSGFEFRPLFDVPVTVTAADARLGRGRLDLRGQYAQVWITNAAQLNDALTRRVGVDPNIAESLRGFYGEAGYRFISGPRGEVGAFARYENFDTQYRMPAGFLPLLPFDRDAVIVGTTYWPDPDVAIKMDYTIVRNRSTVLPAPNSFNLGLGWWF